MINSLVSAVVTTLLLIAVGILLYWFGFVVFGVVGAIRERQRTKVSYPPRETCFGLMTFEDGYYGIKTWSTTLDWSGKEVHMILDDDDGQPDPRAIAYLVTRWDRRDAWLQHIRDQILDLPTEYELSLVSSGERSSSWSDEVLSDLHLEFRHPHDDTADSHYADILADRVISHWTEPAP